MTGEEEEAASEKEGAAASSEAEEESDKEGATCCMEGADDSSTAVLVLLLILLPPPLRSGTGAFSLAGGDLAGKSCFPCMCMCALLPPLSRSGSGDMDGCRLSAIPSASMLLELLEEVEVGREGGSPNMCGTLSKPVAAGLALGPGCCRGASSGVPLGGAGEQERRLKAEPDV